MIRRAVPLRFSLLSLIMAAFVIGTAALLLLGLVALTLIMVWATIAATLYLHPLMGLGMGSMAVIILAYIRDCFPVRPISGAVSGGGEPQLLYENKGVKDHGVNSHAS